MDTKFRLVFGLLLFIDTLLIIIVASATMQTGQDVRDLQNVLATKDELLNLTQVRSTDALEKYCTGCHGENKFSGAHGSESDMLAMIERMQKQAGAHIDASDVVTIHASLELLQCTTCHGEDVTRKLALKSSKEREDVIRTMLKSSETAPDDEGVQRIARSYQQLYGF